jgi:hypothetical protein
MKITNLLIFIFPLLMLGCKKEAAQPASYPTSAFPGATSVQLTTKQPIAVSEWDKIKISDSGDIFVNKKQMSLADFSAECRRLKQVGGAALIYTGEGPHVFPPAQAEAVQKLVVAGVPMKMALKESELD